MTSYTARPDPFSAPLLALSDPSGTSKTVSRLRSYPVNTVPILAIAHALHWIWRDIRPTSPDSAFPYAKSSHFVHSLFSNLAIPSQPIELQSACIRCLPTEILVGIFAMTLNDSSFLDEEPTSFTAQLRTLGHAQLHSLAQVCQWWRAVALESPTLWRTIHLRSVLWTRPDRTELVANLLMSTLKRSGSSTLRISITNRAGEPNPAPSALRLLWEQSERWGEFVFFGTTSSLPDFSVLYGKFSQLHHLHLTVSDLPGTVLDAFQVAPRLKTLAAEIGSQNIAAFSRLQLKQIEHLTILEYADTPTPFFLAAVHRLSRSTTRLAVIFMTPLHQDEMEQSTSLVVSDINILNVWAGGVTLPGTQSALDIVIDNVTLPHLAHLCLYSNTHDTVPWPHSRFISLATRSAFAAHLLTLNIQTFLISEAELLQVLAALPMLNHLLVADHPAPDLVQGAGTVADAQHAASAPLITTSLLAALVRRPDSASALSSSSSIPGAQGETLVPQLITLTFNSVLKFDDWVLFAFLLSRADGTPFVLDLGYPPGRGRMLDPTVSACIYELRGQGHVEFIFSAVVLGRHAR